MGVCELCENTLRRRGSVASALRTHIVACSPSLIVANASGARGYALGAPWLSCSLVLASCARRHRRARGHLVVRAKSANKQMMVEKRKPLSRTPTTHNRCLVLQESGQRSFPHPPGGELPPWHLGGGGSLRSTLLTTVSSDPRGLLPLHK